MIRSCEGLTSRKNVFMSKVVSVVSGVEITEEMLSLYAQRYAEENVPSNVPGFIGAIAQWIHGGSMDSFLTDSPETREAFKEVRLANYKANGLDPASVAYSNVSFAEGVRKGQEEKELIERTRVAHEAEQAAKAEAESQEKAAE